MSKNQVLMLLLIYFYNGLYDNNCMIKLDLKEIKNKLIKLLIDFDNLCKQNGIQYSLAYGTLLGAIRHKGFIPWDDDIDVMMTRENYNKFLSLKNKMSGEKYYIIDNENKSYNYMFAKFVDKETLLIPLQKERYECKIGLYIDIFPIDYVGNTEKEAYKIFKKIRFKHALLVSAQWRNFHFNKMYTIKRQFIRLIFFILSRLQNSKKIIKKLNKNNNPNKTLFCGSLYGSLSSFECFESSLFDEYENISFEKHMFPTIKNTDYYLKKIYGDYLKLPPKKQRFSPHLYNVFLLD